MKRLIALLVTATLLLAFLASCSAFDDSGSDKGPDKPTVPASKTYLEQVGKWAEYLEFGGEENSVDALTKSKIDGDVKDVLDKLIVTETVTENFNEDETLRDTVKVTKWLRTDGSVARTFTSRTAEFPLVEGYPASGLVEYTFNYDVYGMILVTGRELVLKTAEEGAEPFDPTQRASYDEKVTYGYYFEDGSLFVDGLENTLAYRAVDNTSASLDGRFLLDSDEKTYLMKDGVVLASFDKGMEHNIPVYNEDMITAGNPGDYTYFNAYGYNYVISEKMMQYKKVGELYMMVLPGVSVTVMDEDWNVLLSYSSNCYAIAGYTVLENGNFYICEYKLLNSDAKEYDIISGTEKLDVVHKLIDTKTGNIQELDVAFVAQSLFNENTKSIKSVLSEAILRGQGWDLSDTSVKGGYTLALINKFEGGLLDAKSVYAILDNNLSVVAELPAILPDQMFYPCMFAEDVMLVACRAQGTKVLYYGISTKTGEAVLFPKSYNSVIPTEFGYVLGKILYTFDWEQAYDFGSIYTPFVVNGEIYAKSSYGEVYKLYKRTYDYEYGENGSYFELEYFQDFEDSSYMAGFSEAGDLIIKRYSDGTLYSVLDKNANELFGFESEYFDVYSSQLSDYVECYKTKTPYDIKVTDSGYLVTIEVTVERAESNEEESGIPNVESYYEYYVLK